MIDQLSSLIVDNDCVIEFLEIEKSLKLIENNCGLLPKEAQNYGVKRKLEFVAGRMCALKAYQKMTGEVLAELPIGEKREPIWPAGIVGSISHTKRYACAVVSNHLKGLGIDIEAKIEQKRFDKIHSLFISESEKQNFDIDPFVGSLIFSAKESLYKALYPHVKQFFGFKDAQMLEIKKDRFVLKLTRLDGPFQAFQEPIEGRFIQDDEMVLTLIKLL